jgi:pimeloyl-ACP methyl ester carboxylesterase
VILTPVHVSVRGVRLFFDVDGAQLVPQGAWMRERPTILLLHPGPGFDHALYKAYIGPLLVERAQVVYLDLRGHGRSDRSTPEQLTLETWADDVAAFCDALELEQPIVFGAGFGSLVAIRFAARHAERPRALVLAAPVARIVPARSIAVYDRLGGAEAGDAARAYYEHFDERAFADYLRRCLPLLTTTHATADLIARADWSPEVLVHWNRGEGRTFDLRDDLARIRVPTLVVGGEDDAWAPPAAVEEVVESLPPGLVRSLIARGGRHSVFRDSLEALGELGRFLDEVEEMEAE